MGIRLLACVVAEIQLPLRTFLHHCRTILSPMFKNLHETRKEHLQGLSYIALDSAVARIIGDPVYSRPPDQEPGRHGGPGI